MSLLFLLRQDQGANLFAGKLGEITAYAFFAAIVIYGIIWLVKKIGQK